MRWGITTSAKVRGWSQWRDEPSALLIQGHSNLGGMDTSDTTQETIWALFWWWRERLRYLLQALNCGWSVTIQQQWLKQAAPDQVTTSLIRQMSLKKNLWHVFSVGCWFLIGKVWGFFLTQRSSPSLCSAWQALVDASTHAPPENDVFNVL